MEVGDGFAGMAPVIDDEAESGLDDSEFFGDEAAGVEEVAEQRFIVSGGFGDTRNGFFGNDQNVDGCLWIDVLEGGAEIILEYDVGRNLTGDDFFKEGHCDDDSDEAAAVFGLRFSMVVGVARSPARTSACFSWAPPRFLARNCSMAR
jgi:hypothetical protein